MNIRPLTASISGAIILSVANALGAGAQTDEDPVDPRAHSDEIADDAVKGLAERAKEAAAASSARSLKTSKITSRARATAEAAQSEAMQALINEMSPQILRVLGVEDEAGTVLDHSAPPNDRPELITLVFASSSIPLATMRSYAAQLEQTGGAIVFRGAVGGLKKLGPTVDYIMDVLRVDPNCKGVDCDMREVSVLIDPILFRQSGVEMVPAVAVVDQDPFKSYCERESEEALSGSWRLTYGDASIQGHLDVLSTLGDLRARRLSLSLAKEALQ